VLHTTQLLRLSEDLPILIEIVDTEEHVEKLTPILEEMVQEGLVIMEKVRVLKYAACTRPQNPQPPSEQRWLTRP
jgi:PII-like signaling protein